MKNKKKHDNNPNPLISGVTTGTASNDAACSGSTAKNESGTGGTGAVSFTLFSSNQVLSKTFTVNSSGEIEKTATAQLYEGKAQRITQPFSNFVDTLTDATARQATAYGLHDITYPDTVKIRVADKADPDKGVLARTQDYYRFASTSGIVMIDHDPSPYGTDQTPESLLKILIAILPDVEHAARIVRGSLSAGVHFPNEQPKAGKGFRLYFAAQSAGDIKRFGDVLGKRLWLAGHGYIALSRNGAKLVRTLIDGSVFTPERLDFVGLPIVDAALSHTPSTPIYTDGMLLDTTRLPDLSGDEIRAYESMVNAAKQAIEGDSQAQVTCFINAKTDELIAQGSAPEAAQKTIEAIVNSGFRSLFGSFVLDFKNLGKVTVAEVLKNGAKFDKEPLADPVEGRSYGTTTAKFFWNKGRTPCINSFAHGADWRYFLFAEQPLEPGEDYPALENRPCYKVFNDWWFKEKDGKPQMAGMWHFTATNGSEKEPPRSIDSWLCSPLHVIALSRSKHDSLWGNVLRFRNKDGIWQLWNMPSRLLAGTAIEIVGELANNGLSFDRKKRDPIADYINRQHPKDRIFTAETVGWYDTAHGRRFVLPTKTIGGDDVVYRGEFNTNDDHYATQGSLADWREQVAALAVGNHYLTLGICAGFSGALLGLLGNVEGIGIHAHFDSSNGKSTGQAAAASIWGNPKEFVKSWKTTANGLEGGAMLFNDGLYALDEMGDAEPREIADALYTLANGRGRSRANVHGLARKSNTWRVTVLSNGEKTIDGFLSKAGLQAQRGQSGA